MKLFLKQHSPFIFLYLILSILLIGIVWLDGYRKTVILLYGFGLGLFVVTIYLLFVYLTQRNLYKAFSKKIVRAFMKRFKMMLRRYPNQLIVCFKDNIIIFLVKIKSCKMHEMNTLVLLINGFIK